MSITSTLSLDIRTTFHPTFQKSIINWFSIHVDILHTNLSISQYTPLHEHTRSKIFPLVDGNEQLFQALKRNWIGPKQIFYISETAKING